MFNKELEKENNKLKIQDRQNRKELSILLGAGTYDKPFYDYHTGITYIQKQTIYSWEKIFRLLGEKLK